MNRRQDSRLMVLLFTDIVGSVDLKSRLGVAAYARLIARHDELFRQSLAPYPDAEINKDTGDGFLAHFELVDSAVQAALVFLQALRAEPWAPEPIHVRAGLHGGQVEVLPDEQGGPPKLVGLPVDLTARIMGLALPGQLLLSRQVFDDARQYLRAHPPAPALPSGYPLEWRAHGGYVFKGQEEPLPVFEVGAARLAPLAPPPDSEKARREVPVAEEPTLGWRPAAGAEIPHKDGWTLVEKVGEGGFGEAWLGRNRRLQAERIFKFCFDADRLRSFQRELTLFRLLRHDLGDRPDIARLFEVQLEEPPYFLESEYTEHGSLADWAARQGGIDQVPLAVRLDLVARTATALGAAHSVAVLHKDLKPSNLLIYLAEDGSPRPRLADFGIGMLARPRDLGGLGITARGLTETLLAGNESSRTGTRLYAPPELLRGRPFTTQGDVYALGVLLYQMAVGDLARPLAVGWEAEVADELLREDVRACVHGDPEQRLANAHELAERLRALPQRRRRAEVERRRQRQQTLLRRGLAAAAGLVVLLGSGLLVESHRRRTVELERDKAERATRLLQNMLSSPDPRMGISRDVTVLEALDRWADVAREELGEDPQPSVEASVLETLGLAYKNLGDTGKAEPMLRRALDLRRGLDPPEPENLARSALHLGGVLDERGGEEAEAERLLREALELSRAAYPAVSWEVAEAEGALGNALAIGRRFEPAERLLEQAVASSQQLYRSGEPPSMPRRDRAERYAQSLNDLAMLRYDMGDCAAAEQAWQEARKVYERESPTCTDLLTTRFNLAGRLRDKSRLAEAAQEYGEILPLMRRGLGEKHNMVAETLGELAWVNRELARQPGANQTSLEAEALKLLAEARTINPSISLADRPRTCPPSP